MRESAQHLPPAGGGLRRRIGGRHRRAGRASLTVALALAAFVALATSAALAQVPDVPPDPYATGQGLADSGTLPDTDQTPRFQGKETDLFDQVAGAIFPTDEEDAGTEMVFGSRTSFADNLYTVAFSEQVGVGGFAGGSTCESPDPNHESGCKPVLYQYKTFDETQGPEWRRVGLPGEEEPGFVGAVAWIGRTGEALAVGGTGVYPRREPAWRDQCQQWDELDDGAGGRRRLLGAYGSQCDSARERRGRGTTTASSGGRWTSVPARRAA